MALTSGTKLGPYEILAPLGAGGMGEVYRARDTRLDRIVAIKILPAHLSDNPEAKHRFDRAQYRQVHRRSARYPRLQRSRSGIRQAPKRKRAKSCMPRWPRLKKEQQRRRLSEALPAAEKQFQLKHPGLPCGIASPACGRSDETQ